jgi:hypothetical protein
MSISPIAAAAVGAAAAIAVVVAAGASGQGSVQAAHQSSTAQKQAALALQRATAALNYLQPVRSAQADRQNGIRAKRPTLKGGTSTGWQGPQIGDAQVTTAKIADGQVTSPKLAGKLPTVYFAAVTFDGRLDSNSSPGVTASGGGGYYRVTLPTAFCVVTVTPYASNYIANATRGGQTPDGKTWGIDTKGIVGGAWVASPTGFNLTAMCP